MKKNTFLINERNIFEYKTNQKEEILANSELNKQGFPEIWPTRNKDNLLVFISFVDAQIFDKNGNKANSETANFDILDAETYDEKDPNAALKVEFIGALLSPEYRVTGGVYVKGKFYTGQMKKKYALELYSAFMSKYFYIQDRAIIEKYFAKNEDGYFPYWPEKSNKKGQRVIFSAVNAVIYDNNDGKVLKDNINFDVLMGQRFDLDNEEDKMIADTIFMMLDEKYLVKGFYYGGALIPNRINKDLKLYLEKGFIKKNFILEQLDYLYKHATSDDNGQLLFYPMRNAKDDKIVVSFRNGSTPFGEKYHEFDIKSNHVFDPRKEDNQYKIQIIDRIIEKQKDFNGSLYLDGVLIPGKEKYREIMRRKAKVEKELKVRIDGDDDYIRIFNNFTTNDREKLLLLSDSFREKYPNGKWVYPRFFDYDKKANKDFFVFDNVNILDKKGNFVLEKCYSARYDREFSANETEILIFKELFKKRSLVRGGIYLNGKNINKHLNEVKKQITLNKIKRFVDVETFHEILRASKDLGCPYKMDKKSGMLVHWPTFDNEGKEQVLSVVDADVWFKVGRHTVKAANDMNFNIYSGETFGLVGESGSGKTTISRAILGINKLHKGGIYWKGKLISSGLNRRETKAVKKNIQMIFQDPAACLNERANIDYIVSEGLYSFHLFKNKEERLNKVVAMLREVGLLPEHLSRYPHEFSGGQRQRIGIARALVIEPELVLADEPISALDVSIRAQVLNLLKRLQKSENLTYLFIAHDLSIIRYISDRIAVMHNGYVVELGVAEDIYSNPLHPYTKSLLTAIPQPDPKSKDKRVKLTYEQGDIKYKKCEWEEFTPGHFVLVNDEIRDNIKKQLKKK